MTKQELIKEFVKRFGGDESDVRVFSSAGRVNIIGEHIDYCGGEVLPAALSLTCKLAARKTFNNRIDVQAVSMDGSFSLDIDKLESYKSLKWGRYEAGVAYIMQQEGFDIASCQLLYDCNVPFGAGLSSSAAIEVVTAFALSEFSKEMGGISKDNVSLAVIARRAENEYVGVNCGIMDQFASAMGKKDNAIFLNCDTLNYEYVPIDLLDNTLVIINSNKRRSLAESKYNERLSECKEALKILQTRIKSLTALAQVDYDEFEQNKNALSGKVKDRAEHVVYECRRVRQARKAMESGNIELLGRLLNESHYSLRDKYEVTGFELDTLTEIARSFKGCLGARMTGAGFGGCAVAIVKKSVVNEFKTKVLDDYFKATGINAEFYESEISDGAKEI